MTWTTARQKIVIAIFFFFPKMRFSIYNVKRKKRGVGVGCKLAVQASHPP